ncbi:MAG: type III effector [Methylococcaceae bacterium]|nr:MAG: type III effector [Methylococcaceae bacterium]
MTLETFLDQMKHGGTAAIQFEDVLHLIADNYEYQPCAFQNNGVSNAPGSNEGSCRLFAFARRHDLSKAQTLALFGQHYQDVLSNPQGTHHANIRAFMQGGWSGIQFDGEPLTPKSIA